MDLEYPSAEQLSVNPNPLTAHQSLPINARRSIQYLTTSDTASDELVAIPIHYRSHPFTKAEISYPGGPQFSGSEDDDIKVSHRYTDESAIISWLHGQDYVIDGPPP